VLLEEISMFPFILSSNHGRFSLSLSLQSLLSSMGRTLAFVSVTSLCIINPNVGPFLLSSRIYFVDKAHSLSSFIATSC
ncbi:hypothetical protein PFISCL1PPCAC_15697, partial [Pristionchus fissidentatus]